MDKCSTGQHIDHYYAQDQVMARVYERLGFLVLPRELEDLGLENTPQYNPYEDETQNRQSFPQTAEELKLARPYQVNMTASEAEISL